ncbi:MAG: VWA domain-containing protein [Planctomycetia bacterium]|nr:VWA domain-containing protein [Planctomycetia bacterium]
MLLGLWVHPAMLGWLAAAGVPLLIHLLNRRRHREIEWAAMQYLLAAIRKNSRRLKIEQWLLLAVRTLLVVAIVAAVAEPVLERSGLLTRIGQPTHKVLVMDASYSMAYKPADRSRFDRAKQLAEQIVAESSQGDGFTLVLLADPPQVIVGTPSFAPTEFLGEIAALKITHGGADLAATLAKIEQILQAARREYPRLGQQQVFFLSDLGRTTWAPDATGAAVAEFRERSQRLGDAAVMTVIDLGQSAAENMAVEQLRLADPIVTVGQETQLAAEVRNFGRQPKSRQMLELLIDGRRAADRVIDLPPGGRVTVGFPHRFDAPGDHAVELRLAADLLDVDNHRYLALPVKDQIRVLCVDGRPSGGEFKSATDYLAVALSPAAGQQLRARVRPEVVSERALLDADLTHFDCVFLCDVAQFTDREARVLRSYLNWGGGLVFFLGPQVMADNYNRQLAHPTAEDHRVLPAQLLRPVEEAHYGLNPLQYRHPLVTAFRDQEQAGLLTTPVHKYFKLQVPEKSRAQVAVALDGGDPFIVEEPLGRGRSILVATTADATWTAMPMWPSYVPIVQELLMLATRGQIPEHNVLVGQTLGGLLPSASGQSVDIRLPAGETKRATVTGDGAERYWSFPDTATSGIFQAQGAARPANQATSESFAVNVNTVESDLTQVDAEELSRDVWPGVRYYHRTNWQNSDAAVDAEIVVRSRLHLWLLWLALALVVTESFLTWFTGRQAR